MSINTSMDTITVNDVTYDVKREHTNLGYNLTIEQFPGLEGYVGMEEYIEPYMSPRDWSNVGTMAVSYGRYNLGDEDISEIDFDVECDRCEGAGEHIEAEYAANRYNSLADPRAPIQECDKCEGRGCITLNPVEYFKQQRGARVVLGLTVYEHSGITMYVGDVTIPFDTDRWDTSFVGFIFDTPEGVKQCIGDNATDEEIKAALEAEVKVYASYLEGDVSRYSIDDSETNYTDACGGYVGDTDHCEAECFSSMENAIVKRLAENKERAEWAARDTITQ
jgi:hypothetical protein